MDYFEPQWVMPDQAVERTVTRLINERPMPDYFARILATRGINAFKEAEAFINPSLDDLRDPFLFRDMGVAIERLKVALRNSEHIMILGDYDVDGVCGTSLFLRVMSNLGARVSYYIPNRFKEGYGVSTGGVDAASKVGASLILTVDSGITAFDGALDARSKNIDFIITDHHEPQSEIPDAMAIINPKTEGSSYPFRELAGVGVMFKLLQGLYTDMGLNLEELYDELDLVALGTAADVVPLVDENRILTKFGIRRMRETANTGLAALMEVSGAHKGKVNSSNIIHILAPRLNAPGRLSTASKTVELLISNNWLKALKIADEIEKENAVRRQMNDQVFVEADAMLKSLDIEERAGGIVLASENWHQGVIGIAASRIVERYNSPTILISLEGGIGKGSARSIKGFDICTAISECEEILTNYGGHKYAVGLTIDSDKIEELKERFGKIMKREMTAGIPRSVIMIDTEIDITCHDSNMIKFLEKLSPFGESNPVPIFRSRNLRVVNNPRIVGNNHLKFKVTNGYVTFDAIAFNMGEHLKRISGNQSPIEILYNVEENEWRGSRNIQFIVKAIK